MKKQKTYVAMLLAALVILSLAGCGMKNSNDNAEATTGWSVENPDNTISSVLSFKMSDENYMRVLENGWNDNDTIDVYLKAESSSGYDQVHCKMALKDFMHHENFVFFIGVTKVLSIKTRKHWFVKNVMQNLENWRPIYGFLN